MCGQVAILSVAFFVAGTVENTLTIHTIIILLTIFLLEALHTFTERLNRGIAEHLLGTVSYGSATCLALVALTYLPLFAFSVSITTRSRKCALILVAGIIYRAITVIDTFYTYILREQTFLLRARTVFIVETLL